MTHYNLSRGQQHQNSILASIATTQVSQFIARTPVDRPGYNVGPRNRAPVVSRGYNGVNPGYNGLAGRNPAIMPGHAPFRKAPFTSSANNGFAGSSVGNPSSSRQRNGAQMQQNQQFQSSPRQNKNRKAESDSRNSSTKQAPVKFIQSQNQQIWRPKIKDATN